MPGETRSKRLDVASANREPRHRNSLMTTSIVYFTNLRSSYRDNLLSKLHRLLDHMNTRNCFTPRNLVAIKLHFGEKGNMAFVRPNYIRLIVDYIKGLGAQPFLTDTNSLYAGSRGDSISHIRTAIENGFAYAVVNAPVVIGDGLRGASYQTVRIDKTIFKEAYIGNEIFHADGLISVAHFKGHELSGFGGTIKNLSMGCASRKGKLEQHSDLSPKVKRKRCIGCGECVMHCVHSSISLEDGKAVLDPEQCVGCGECVLICQQQAIQVRWNADSALFQKKLAEYAFAVLKNKQGKALFLNFLMQISPACDCAPFNDVPFVHDLGIMGSTDPVAIDQASVDIINQEATSTPWGGENKGGEGEDKFRGLYPKIDWSVQLEYAESIGLGKRDYERIDV